MNKQYKASAIVVAAGSGSRMNACINKQYLLLSGKPILAHTLEVFEGSFFVSEIIVVINREEHEQFEDCILKPYKFAKIKAVVDGGATRQESVFNGLAKVSDGIEIVAVHDGARPFVTLDIIKDSIDIAAISGAACVGVPAKDTIKQVNQSGIVEKTLERATLWSIQTPQVFSKIILKKAHRKAIADGFIGTDDCSLVERLGQPVQMVMGSYSNIKITTPEDLAFAEILVKK